MVVVVVVVVVPAFTYSTPVSVVSTADDRREACVLIPVKGHSLAYHVYAIAGFKKEGGRR
jgi:hypothetical protein